MSVSQKEREAREKRKRERTIPSSNGSPNQFNPNLVHSLGDRPEEGFLLISPDKLVTFQNKGNGDFTPLNDEELKHMADTMDDNGPNEPIIVRQLDGANEKFEILSGEQRYRASKLKGLKQIRCIIVRNCDDQRAKQIFLISNLSRRRDRIKDRIYGWKQFSELNSGHISKSLKEANIKESLSSISIYIKCADLIDELIACMDSGKLSLKAGYQLSFLTSQEQRITIPYATKITETISRDIRDASAANNITDDWLLNYFEEKGVNDSSPAPSSEQSNLFDRQPSYTRISKSEQYEQALKRKTTYEKNIRKGMRKIRTDIIGRVSPRYYDKLADIISNALDLYLESNKDLEINDEEMNELTQLYQYLSNYDNASADETADATSSFEESM